MKHAGVLGERYVTKVGAVFETADEARRAAELVTSRVGLAPEQVRVVEPGDPRESRKLEPESRGIARTLVQSHLVLGALGAVGGALLAAVLLATEVRAFTASPWITFAWLTAFGAVAGLLLGGLVSLRPDHDPLNMKVEEETRSASRWAIVVHVRDHATAARAREVLESLNGEVMATL
jgi:hypothetical protein